VPQGLRGWGSSIDLAHQLADVLTLPGAAAAAGGTAGVTNGIDQGARAESSASRSECRANLLSVLAQVLCCGERRVCARSLLGRFVKIIFLLIASHDVSICSGWYNSALLGVKQALSECNRPDADEKGSVQLRKSSSFVLEEAARQGATQAAADASINQGLGVTARLGEVETVEYQRDRGLGVTVYFGHRKGLCEYGRPRNARRTRYG